MAKHVIKDPNAGVKKKIVDKKSDSICGKILEYLTDGKPNKVEKVKEIIKEEGGKKK